MSHDVFHTPTIHPITSVALGTCSVHRFQILDISQSMTDVVDFPSLKLVFSFFLFDIWVLCPTKKEVHHISSWIIMVHPDLNFQQKLKQGEWKRLNRRLWGHHADLKGYQKTYSTALVSTVVVSLKLQIVRVCSDMSTCKIPIPPLKSWKNSISKEDASG